jgi:L-ascorbate metabolism protein UlaG (beta-lactamase superfamily)
MLWENAKLNFSKPARVKNKLINPINTRGGLSVIWIGHASVMVQMDDKVMLFDPFLTNNIGLIQRRVQEPGLDINNLAKCDFIFISHTHFDHLNLGSLEILEKYFPGCRLVFPSGAEEFIPDMNFKFKKLRTANINRKKYKGESVIIDSVKITSVAAYHWGGRYGLDGLIWGYSGVTGYIVQYHGLTVYFSGDTGYNRKFFKYLGKKYKIDAAIIPIGPCKDCGKTDKTNRHIYPPGALKVLDDTKASVLIPVHFGTIHELSEPYYPLKVLTKVLKKNPEYKDRVKILKIGEIAILKSK